MKAWIARNESGILRLWRDKPTKDVILGLWESDKRSIGIVRENEFEPGYFGSVKWEDKEPTECEYWPNYIDDMQYITLKKEMTFFTPIDVYCQIAQHDWSNAMANGPLTITNHDSSRTDKRIEETP